MIRARWAVLALALAVALFAMVPGAGAQATGTIRGRLANKSAQGESVAGQTVNLLAFNEGAEKDKRTATTAADGTFTFADLPTTGQQYVLAADYLGVTYYSEEIDLSQGEASREVELAVYSTTDKADALSITRSHLIVDVEAEQKALVVLEALIVSNAGDRTYVGGEKMGQGVAPTLRLKLPKGAVGVQFSEGLSEERSVVMNDMVVDTAPVLPGPRQIVLSYFVPYEGASASLARGMDYPIERAIVLVRDIGAEVSAEGLPNKDTREFSGARYVQLSGDNLKAGQTLSIQLDNIPATIAPQGAASAGSVAGQGAVWAAAGLAGLALALGVAYPLLRRRRGASARVASVAASASSDWDRLVQAIAALDDEYDAGRVPEEEYRRRRAEKKAQLLELSRRLGKA